MVDTKKNKQLHRFVKLSEDVTHEDLKRLQDKVERALSSTDLKVDGRVWVTLNNELRIAQAKIIASGWYSGDRHTNLELITFTSEHGATILNNAVFTSEQLVGTLSYAFDNWAEELKRRKILKLTKQLKDANFDEEVDTPLTPIEYDFWKLSMEVSQNRNLDFESWLARLHELIERAKVGDTD